MKKYLIIDGRMRKIEKEKLVELGYELINIPNCKDIYFEISSHVDIFCTKVKDKIIFEKRAFESIENINFKNEMLNRGIIIGNEIVGEKYPLDILYNVCCIGNFVIHNFKYTDKKVLNIINSLKLKKIDVKQGYSKCSIAVIDNNSVITGDEKIANELINHGIDALICKDINNIKLLSKDKKYSDMYGFIGGAISKIGNKIFVSGDLTKIDRNNKIREFIQNRDLEIIEFKGLDVIDYGGMVEI